MVYTPRPSLTAIRWFLIFLLIFGIGWLIVTTQTGIVSASHHYQVSVTVITAQTTATVLPTEFSAEVVREGQPTGIIVGAIAIVLLIVLGTLPFLLRKRNSEDLE